MPIYEYRCDQGHTFEVMQRISDDPIELCQTCERPVRRVFHPVAVHFKGSGFYNTDYGKQRRGRGGEEGDGGSSDGDAAKAADSSSGEAKTGGSEAKGASKDGSAAAGSSGAVKAGSDGSSSSSNSS